MGIYDNAQRRDTSRLYTYVLYVTRLYFTKDLLGFGKYTQICTHII